jgi:hypothetical protein
VASLLTFFTRPCAVSQPRLREGQGIAHESLTKLFLASEALGDATVGALNKDVYFDPRETHG